MAILIRWVVALLVLGMIVGPVRAESPSVRVKDLGRLIENRSNQLMGFGLVVGLKNTGDSRNSIFTAKALTNLLRKMGITPDQKEFSARNVAAVMVTSTLPAYVKKGQQLSVAVSAVGDCTSLVGGTLLMTELRGANEQVIALAQGPVVVGGISEAGSGQQFVKNQPTVGYVSHGAIVEVEVPVTAPDMHNITIVLDQPDYMTVSRIVRAIRDSGIDGVYAVDPNTIKIPLGEKGDLSIIDYIAKIENVRVVPDMPAKVVINSKTGTIIVGEMVRLMPVAITQGGISIRVSPQSESDGNADQLVVTEDKAKLVYLNPEATLSSLAQALNDLGASPKDLISIIQALKESGALVATLEII